MRNPFKRREKSLELSQAVHEALTDFRWLPYRRLGGGSQERIQRAYSAAQSESYAWLYARSPAVRTVLDCLIRNVGQLDMRLYEEIYEEDGGSYRREPDPEHPAAMSLRYPTPRKTQDQFVREMFKDYLIYDNAFALKEPVGAELSLFRIPAHMMEITGSNLFDAEIYRFHGRDGGQRDFSPDQVLHWHGEHPQDPRIGLSHLETLREVIAEDIALQQAIIELASSGLAQPSWVYRPLEAEQWSNEARGRFEEDLTNRLRKSNRTPPVMEEGMELRNFGVSPKDAEMLEVRRYSIQRIASEYGVPLGMVGLDDNLAEAQEQFYSDTLPPYCESFTKMLNLQVLVQVFDEPDYCFEFNLDEKRMGNERLKALTSAAGVPPLLRNETRAMLNLPPVDGGEVPLIPVNMQDGSDPEALLPSNEPAVKPGIEVMPPQDPNKPPQDGSYREDQGPTPLPAGNRTVKATHYLPRRAGIANRRAGDAEKFTAILRRHFNRQSKVLSSQAGSGEPKSVDKLKAKAANTERWDEELAADLYERAQDVVAREGGIAAARMAGEFDADQTVNYLKAKALGAAQNINQATAEHIADKGSEDAFLQAREVRAVGEGMSYATSLFAWSAKEALNQARDPEGRMVTVSGGECEVCAPHQGTFRPAEVPGWPPFHTNCNCIAEVA